MPRTRCSFRPWRCAHRLREPVYTETPSILKRRLRSTSDMPVAEIRKSLVCLLRIAEPSIQMLREQVDGMTGLLRNMIEARAGA